ncbi:MAG: hypothetical protein KKE44_07985, partial [Proteobacteria bacterium]|nr:hypothetical protein [Pseudomonadota bacterium]
MEKIEKFPSSISNVFRLFFVSIAISFAITILLLIFGKIIISLFYPEILGKELIKNISFILLEIFIYSSILFYITTKPNRTWNEILRFTTFHKLILIPLTILIIGNMIVLSEIDNIFRYLVPIPDIFSEMLAKTYGNGGLSFIF